MSQTPIATEIKGCRVCGSGRLDTVIDFGTPYISDFLEPLSTGARAPLHAVRCFDCGLVQLLHTVDRDLLYRDHYWYRSGINESMREELRSIVDSVGQLGWGAHVLDIGANDGTLLSMYPQDVRKWAVEPSASFPIPGRVPTYYWSSGFWPLDTDIGEFKVITSIACFYDADDPHAFVEAIKKALAPDGVWIVQFQDADSILDQNAVDYFCHEHLCLYSRGSFGRLLREHGLSIQQMQRSPINGGSLRFRVVHGNEPLTPAEVIVPSESRQAWVAFADRASHLRNLALLALIEFVTQGKQILGVAASTKANYLLQWYDINSNLLPAIVERDTEKIGRLTAGSGIPIISEETGVRLNPDYYVALAWHFLDGLRARAPTVPFITLLPDVKVWPAVKEAVRA